MVDKRAVNKAKSEIGKSISAYTSDEALSDKELTDIVDDFEYGTAFTDFDEIILHGSPSTEEDDLRYDLFETVAFYLQSQGRNPQFHAPEQFRDNINESDSIYEKSVNFISPKITEDELNKPYNREAGTGRIHITSDYHAEGVESISRAFDQDDFVVLSANTVDKDFPEEKYLKILGSAGEKLEKLPLNWEFWAEGKELGRKIADWRRGGPRF